MRLLRQVQRLGCKALRLNECCCQRIYVNPGSRSKIKSHHIHTFAAEKQSRFSTVNANQSTNSDQDIKRYLCRDKSPLGSLSAKNASDIVSSIQILVTKASPLAVALAVELLDRLCQEVEFCEWTNDKRRWLGEIIIPDTLIHDVVRAWQSSRRESTQKHISPRELFQLVNQCFLAFPVLRRNLVPYNMIIHAAAAKQDTILAEEILNHLLDAKNGVEKTVNVVSFTSVINAWAKSGRDDAAQRAEAVLQKMIDYSNAGNKEATPNVVSYSCVMKAWANSNQDEAPQRAEALLCEIQSRGLRPNSISFSSFLTAWARSSADDAPARAHAILKHMRKLSQDGLATVQPNARCYSAVISKLCESR